MQLPVALVLFVLAQGSLALADDLTPAQVAERCENNRARLAELKQQSEALPLLSQFQGAHIADDMVAVGDIATHESITPADVKLIGDMTIRYGFNPLTCVGSSQEECGLKLLDWMKQKDRDNAGYRTEQEQLLTQMHAHETNLVALGCDAPTLDVSGEWASNWGAMHLGGSGTVEGTYDYQDGKVYGQMTGSVLEGKWSQTASGSKCERPELGSYYWGRIKWTFAPDGKSFSGSWSYCNGEVGAGDWTGTKN